MVRSILTPFIGVVIVSSIGRAFVALYGEDSKAVEIGELYIKGWQKMYENST
jgi:hypothetical protein